MPKATMFTSAVEVFCPKCEDPVPSDGGSFIWTADEIRSMNGRAVECMGCNTLVTIQTPTMVRFN